MKAAQAFDGGNMTTAEELDGRSHRVLGRNDSAFRIQKFEPRAAIPASIRLRVEAPVPEVIVLRLAGKTHAKGRHRSEPAVIGNTLGDGEAGAAIGAVDEWIAVAPVV